MSGIDELKKGIEELKIASDTLDNTNTIIMEIKDYSGKINDGIKDINDRFDFLSDMKTSINSSCVNVNELVGNIIESDVFKNLSDENEDNPLSILSTNIYELSEYMESIVDKLDQYNNLLNMINTNYNSMSIKKDKWEEIFNKYSQYIDKISEVFQTVDKFGLMFEKFDIERKEKVLSDSINEINNVLSNSNRNVIKYCNDIDESGRKLLSMKSSINNMSLKQTDYLQSVSDYFQKFQSTVNSIQNTSENNVKDLKKFNSEIKKLPLKKYGGRFIIVISIQIIIMFLLIISPQQKKNLFNIIMIKISQLYKI